MKLGIYLSGACGQSKNLYRARNEAKRGRACFETVNKQAKEDSKHLIQTQESKDFSYIIDPQFLFYDLLQPFAEQMQKVQLGPQENWFNNNLFYRRPQIEGPLKKLSSSFMQDYLHTDLLKEKKSMAILPSPYTLLSLSNISGYQNKKEAICNLSSIIRHEAELLIKKGFSRIQFDEPTIAIKQSLGSLKEDDLKLLSISINELSPLQGASTSLHTYFGDVGPLIPFLIKLPIDCIGIDCTETCQRDILKHNFSEKELALGLVNSRTPAMENVNKIIDKIQKIAITTSPKKIYLTPNTGLEYIGWTLGNEKLSILELVKKGFEHAQ